MCYNGSMKKELSEKRIAQIAKLNSMPRDKKWVENMKKAHLGPRPGWKYKDPRIRRRNTKARYVQKTFGITIEEYERIMSTYSSCEICGGDNKLSLDHRHDTSLIRGVLCRNCNLAIGLFEDDIDRLKKAIEYLLKYQKGV